ncbi:hypothetical protein [Halosolutus gelatinilyticus]|uniref:hypothetical protein n=1 Tax=Halosolutus gelatinilyticus TaxID=2931975 RepID=UPI001FF4916F|nr:hypothetical protein [Halosolutus gelatinilyticus]
MTSSDDGGYVHDPSAFDENDARRESADDSLADSSSDDWVDDPAHPDAADREFDWRGWVLVGVIFFAFVVAPATIILLPPSAEGYRFALLIVPLAPALLLAVTAIWATTRP